MARNVSPQQGQLGIEGIGQDVPLDAPPVYPDLRARNAFARVPFPQYFGVDPATFDAVTQDAYEQSDPRVIEPKLYQRTDLSMRSPDRSVGWVLLGGTDYRIVLDYPEALAKRASARYLTSMAALIKPQDERNAAAQRAGAHALESRVEPMKHLIESYHVRIGALRRLTKRIPKHWYAHTTEMDMRLDAQTARDAMRDTLQTVADVEHWSTDELALALTGLDSRLMEGRGKVRMDQKKAAWMDLSRVVGNHSIAKKTLVRDRLMRSEFEIDKRLKNGHKEV